LKSAHRAFTKSFNTTSTQEIYTLHRNGIVHGNLLSFNNLVVATKAWNRLMAVKDWATAIEKAKQPPAPPPPPVWESFKQIAATVRRHQTLKEWEPRTVELERDGAEKLEHEPVAAAASDFFEAWQREDYGTMSKYLRERSQVRGAGRFAGIVRGRFAGSRLTEFRVVSVQMMTASLALVTAELTLDGRSFVNEERWVYEDRSRNSIPEFESGGDWLLSFNDRPDDFTERR
jgi:hypothetical protein